ncbi:tetratricopeptide repeat protein [Salipiger sp. IMCC34102]|uniref:tetratricopeptide repeat protein n=1 Tax=Salipiger sp. IMCC34102 TaxID=2510647 RepID=UPI00101CFE0E|nr:tetratricopeptide repeat protein [Salipiger sp. IMCC34102]RYH02370.1 tetratricopeptide repeat protein [Salipiger sp. IMCC34102]
MSIYTQILNAAVATFLWAATAQAQTDELDALYDRLAQADAVEAEGLRGQIQSRWSQSGSPAMDLLLRRAEDAMEVGDPDTAVAHFSALIDHAPGFAEGYHGRATVLFAQGRLGQALADLRRTLELNPRHFNAMTGLAVILSELGQTEEALEVYRQVDQIAPHLDRVETEIGRLSVELDGTAL